MEGWGVGEELARFWWDRRNRMQRTRVKLALVSHRSRSRYLFASVAHFFAVLSLLSLPKKIKIREIFTGDGVAPIKSIRSDVGDTWFVTMDSEDDALSTILALRSKTFEGKPVKARLKSENILRSFFPVPTAAEVQPTAAAAAAAPYTLGGPGGGMAGMPYGMPAMGTPMMNGQPNFGFPGPGARGMYGSGGLMMPGPAGGMRFGGMQHAGMVQGGQGGGRVGMMQGRGGMQQMGGIAGMSAGNGGGGHQGHGMGRQMMGMNPKQQQQVRRGVWGRFGRLMAVTSKTFEVA